MPRTIVITGVTRGLGRALVDRFAEAGHLVCGCGRTRDAIEALRRDHPAPHHFAVVDVVSDSQVQGWAEEVLARHGPPDLLLNNAALINRKAPLWELFPDEVDDVVDVNIKGTANVLRHFLPSMVQRGQGVVVNLSSGWGRSTSPGVAPYCATKYAVEGLTGALAQELPRTMAAVALNPGIVDTDMLRIAFGDDAGGYPDADAWSRRAAPFLLGLGPQHSGHSLTVT